MKARHWSHWNSLQFTRAIEARMDAPLALVWVKCLLVELVQDERSILTWNRP